MKVSYPEKKGQANDLKFNNRFGKYIFSNYNTWHGGIHIEGRNEPILAIADGRIIAYRFTESYQFLTETIEDKTIEYDYSNCFVLMQHDMEVVKNKIENKGEANEIVKEEKRVFTFYSLYNHLMPIEEIDANESLSFPIFMGNMELVVSKQERFEFEKKNRKGLNARVLDGKGKVGNSKDSIKIVVPVGKTVNKVFDLEGKEITNKNSSDVVYNKVTFTDEDGSYYDSIYICIQPNGTKNRVIDKGETYEICTEEDSGTWEDKTAIPEDKRDLKGARVREKISDGKITDIIPYGEKVRIKETVGDWYKIEGWEGFSHKQNFKTKIKFDENKIKKDAVIACDIAIEAGTMIGYTGKLGGKVDANYSACHLDVFMEEDVTAFLKNEFEAGNNSKDLHFAIIEKGTVLSKNLEKTINLRAGLPVKILEVKDGYANIQVVECDAVINSVKGILYTENTDNLISQYKGYSTAPKGYHIINLASANSYFNGALTEDDKTLIYKATTNNGLGRTVTFKPKQLGTTGWVKIEDLNLVYHEKTKTRLVLSCLKRIPDSKSFADYLKNRISLGPLFDLEEYKVTELPKDKVGETTTIKNQIKTIIIRPPVAGTSEKVTEDVVVDLSGCEKIKTENLEFIKIKCDYVLGANWMTQEGWIENKLQTFSAYDWTKFGFKELSGGSEYLYDLKSNDSSNFLLKDIWKKFDIKKEDGMIDSDELNIAFSILETQRMVSKIVCQHKLEWSYEPDTIVQQVEKFFDDQIKLKPEKEKEDLTKIKKEKLDVIKEQAKKTMFWGELTEATYTPEPSERDKEYETKKTEINNKYNAVAIDASANTNEKKQAELDTLDKEYKKGEYAPKERTVPNADNVYCFHPVAFVEQLKRLSGCCGGIYCIKKGDKSELIREINIRLAGFGGNVPTDEFTERTENMVKQFQRDYMKVAETGKVCGNVLKAIDDFQTKYNVDISEIKCKCDKCAGFGNERNIEQYQKTSIEEAIRKYEYPGIHRSLVFGYRASLFYLEKEKQLGYKTKWIESGYRCHKHPLYIKTGTTNHCGKALDIHYNYLRTGKRASAIKEMNLIRKEIFNKYLGAKYDWEAKNVFNLESWAETWVHIDVRAFSQEYLQKEYFAKDIDALNGKNLIDLAIDLGYRNTCICNGGNNTSSSETAQHESMQRVDPKTLKASSKLIQFIKDWEKLRKVAYNDKKDYCTIGYGHLISKNKCENIQIPDKFKRGITEELATQLFTLDLQEFEKAVQRDVTVKLHQREFDALVDLLFNCGANFLSENKAPKLYKNLLDEKYEDAAKEFLDIENELRRKQNYEMFINGNYDSTH